MANETTQAAIVIDTPAGIHNFRFAAIRAGLGLRAKGLRFNRGRDPVAAAKQELEAIGVRAPRNIAQLAEVFNQHFPKPVPETAQQALERTAQSIKVMEAKFDQ